MLGYNYSYSQSADVLQLKKSYEIALTNNTTYDWLRHLSNQIGGRLSGSLQMQRAVTYTKSSLDNLGLDKVWLQPVLVSKWVRGADAFSYFETTLGVTTNLPIVALGGSVATALNGVKAALIEIQSSEDLEKLGSIGIKGKIVFFNIRLNPLVIHPMKGYIDYQDALESCIQKAGLYGAVGIIATSPTFSLDDLTHTGYISYDNVLASLRIPVAAVSTNSAALLSASLALNPDINFYFKQNCKQLNDIISHNVIGEIRGTKYPKEIIVLTSHLDSWYLGDGALGSGAGCAQSIEALRSLLATWYKPKRTVRVVLFADGEMGLHSVKKYLKGAAEAGENHVLFLNASLGGLQPIGFHLVGGKAEIKSMESWKPLLEPYGIFELSSGSDLLYGQIEIDNTPISIGLTTNAQQYFDYHHSENDRFKNVNKRSLAFGSASLASFIYLINMIYQLILIKIKI